MPTTLHPSLSTHTTHLTRQTSVAAANSKGPEVPRYSGGTRQLGSLAAPLARALAHIDATLADLLTLPLTPQDDSSLLELQAALLRDAHTSLAALMHRDGPHAHERVDAIIAETVLEAAEHGTQLAADLEAGGLARLERCWSGCRQWATEVGLAGGDAAPLRERVKQAKAQLLKAPGTVEEAEVEVASIFATLAGELGARRQSQSSCLLDRLLFPDRSAYKR